MFTNKTLALFRQKQPLFICIFTVLVIQISVTAAVFYLLRDTENPLLEDLKKKLI